MEFRASLSVDSEVYKELSDLSDARRIAVNHDNDCRYRCSYGLMTVNHDNDKPIPLQLWLDAPDWRPEGWQGKWIK